MSEGMYLDHLAVTAESLEEGAAWAEAALGVALVPGGTHAAMGTHNRLLRLGDVYLEVIAIDPAAAAPGRPRWFAMDRFRGPPRLTNWILRCDDLAAELAQGPAGLGAPLAFTRGDLAWQMAVPANGMLPFGGLFPALIQWQGAAHPVARLPESGCRLVRLRLSHPDAPALAAALAGRLTEPRLEIVPGSPGLAAEIATPSGLRVLA